MIRHGEKPPDSPPPHGVDVDGEHDPHSLVPRGWQRAGALATLFAPRDAAGRPPQPPRPKRLLGGAGDQAGKALAAVRTGVTLVCWEHTAIPTIGASICPGGPIPSEWPGDRFDVVWSFTLDPGTGTYAFEQIPQLLLAGDIADPIALCGSGKAER